LSTRSYHSQLRQKQAEETRELILSALAEQLASDGLQDFSIAEAAKVAGVSTRTIYRYFPNRDALLDGVAEWVDQKFPDLPHPSTLPEIFQLVREGFPEYDRQEKLVRALLVTKLGKSVRSHLFTRRWEMKEALTSLKEKIPNEEDGEAICALIQYLAMAETWNYLHHECGISGQQSGKVVAWVIQLIADALENGDGKSFSA
jgi:AcrR family transcriptional regulator